ncbi:MAG: hypothetical protein AAFQ01_02860, partial [Bacteroidota bacterium]
LKESLIVFEHMGDDHHIQLNLNNLGMVALAEKDYRMAVTYFDRSTQVKGIHTNLAESTHAYQELITIYKRLGQVGKALACSERLNALTIPLVGLNAKLEVLHLQYQADAAQLMIDKFVLSEILFEERYRNAKIIATLLALLLAGSLAFFLHRLHRIEKRKRQVAHEINLIQARYEHRVS